MAMWSDDEQHDGRIDAAIDEVARRMTEGAPDSAFKVRVLARVDDDRPSSGRRLAWMLSPLAIAALIIIAVVVFRQFDRQSRSVPTVTQRDKPAEAFRPGDTARGRGPVNDVPTAPRTAEIVASQTHALAHPAASRRPQRAAIASTSSGEVDALAPPPLEVESIRLAALPPANSIRVAPLETITPIDVAPLAEPDIENEGESRRR
ncbi:MAG TPA: hypothetical protein VGQ16_02040 [Vicinamibacterales bacterium]|nr:hypothetical protein [Vicinamibacterales bacterium]